MTEHPEKVNDHGKQEADLLAAQPDPSVPHPSMGEDGTGGYGQGGPTSAASPTGGLGVGKGEGYPFAK